MSSKPRRSRYRYLNNKDSDDDSDDALLEDEENYLSVSDALSIVRDPLADTMAPPAVEQHVWNRISGYVHLPRLANDPHRFVFKVPFRGSTTCPCHEGLSPPRDSESVGCGPVARAKAS